MLKYYYFLVDLEMINLNPQASQNSENSGIVAKHGKPQDDPQLPHKYLSVVEVSDLTGHAPQTIYNNVHKKVFIEGIHYFKPSSKKLLFKWEPIVKWIEDSKITTANARMFSPKAIAKKTEKSELPVSAINI